ncbi:MAG: hypothetical protein KAZ88_06840 [Acidimicrobiia bacterium]|nr:hypothetical protein [Acidimicrobiia bacterium]MBP8180690.1 hypothetical protein [Acidimicrobiia bacterium]
MFEATFVFAVVFVVLMLLAILWASGPTRENNRREREHQAELAAKRAQARRDSAAQAAVTIPEPSVAEQVVVPPAPVLGTPSQDAFQPSSPPLQSPAIPTEAPTDQSSQLAATPSPEAPATPDAQPTADNPQVGQHPKPAGDPKTAERSAERKAAHKPLTKYSANSWMIWDLPDVETGAGLVAATPGLLQTEGKLVARTFTYQLALLDEHRSGAVGGIKAAPGALGEDGEAWAQGAGSLLDAGQWAGYSANFPSSELGAVSLADAETVFEAEAASLRAVLTEALPDGETARVSAIGLSKRIVVGLTELAREGRVKLVAASSPSGTLASPDGLDLNALSAALDAHPRDWLAGIDETSGPAWGALSTPCDVLLVGNTAGVSHDFQDRILARTVVGVADGAVTPRALAQLQRRGAVVWSDIVATLGRVVVLLGGSPLDAFNQTLAVAHAVGAHADGPTIGAFELAEASLRTWRGEIPVSRPLP